MEEDNESLAESFILTANDLVSSCRRRAPVSDDRSESSDDEFQMNEAVEDCDQRASVGNCDSLIGLPFRYRRKLARSAASRLSDCCMSSICRHVGQGAFGVFV